MNYYKGEYAKNEGIDLQMAEDHAVIDSEARRLARLAKGNIDRYDFQRMVDSNLSEIRSDACMDSDND